jgi:hypothetical protein
MARLNTRSFPCYCGSCSAERGVSSVLRSTAVKKVVPSLAAILNLKNARVLFMIIRAWRATVELYWQGKTEELGENLSQCHFVHGYWMLRGKDAKRCSTLIFWRDWGKQRLVNNESGRLSVILRQWSRTNDSVTSLPSRLGGVLVSMLATGPSSRRFKPGGGDKNPQHTFLRMGGKAGRSLVVRFYDMLTIRWRISDADTQSLLPPVLLAPRCLCW